MDEGIGWLIGLGLVIGAIYLFIVYVVPIILGIAAIILTIFAVIGCLVGTYYGIRNFVAGITETRNKINLLGCFKDKDIMKKVHDEAPNGIYSDFVYEECARKSFFLGPCFQAVGSIIKEAFSENFDTKPDFSRGEVWYTKVLFFIWSLCQLFAQYILGTIMTLALSAVLLVVSLVFTSVVYVLFGIVLAFETLYFKLKKVSFRCQKCTRAYKVPVYACPNCNIKHVRLKPGKYGVFKRKCVCGTILPLTVRATGKKLVKDPTTGNYIKEKYNITDMKSFCPHCGNSDKAGITHPVSIALIGGASAGKTTFKVAFLKDFLDEEIVNYGIDFEFPDDSYDNEFKQIESYYRGIPIPPTPYGAEYDIITFSFMLKHKKFGVDRLVHIYDMPGEVFQKGNAQEGWHYTQQIESQLQIQGVEIIEYSPNNSNIRQIPICSVPFAYQEDQSDRETILDACEITFCARTGKIFIMGNYNSLKEFLAQGGKLNFISSDNIELNYDDNGEHLTNVNNSAKALLNLHSLFSRNVVCKRLQKAPNVSMLKVLSKSKKSFIDVKFNFQSGLQTRHPLFTLNQGNPFYDIFDKELRTLWDISEEIDLKELIIG